MQRPKNTELNRYKFLYNTISENITSAICLTEAIAEEAGGRLILHPDLLELDNAFHAVWRILTLVEDAISLNESYPGYDDINDQINKN